MLGLQRLEPLHQHIILIVGNDRRIEDIIELVVIFQFAAQAKDLFLYVHRDFLSLR